MNQILAALLNAQPANAAQSSTSASNDKSASTDAGSPAQFKSQFDQAVQTLANAAASNQNQQGSTATTTSGTAQAATAGSSVQSASVADSLQDNLKKKIADLLAKGESVTEIVQQLAAALAQQIAQQFGGDPTQIQNQLQTAFTSALTPPSGTGPPPTDADLASALAQRFRQVADVAAGVLGETGQSNRLFAGSILDAATTAGVQPAPTTTATPPTTSVADSMAQSAQALLATLTASQGDGKTVATTGTNVSTNGDTLLGRILARAQQAAQDRASTLTQAQAPDPAPATIPTGSSALASLAMAAASAALSSAAAVTAPDPSAAAAQRIVASSHAALSDTSAMPVTEAAPATVSPAVAAFLKSFTEALSTTSVAVNAKTIDANDSSTDQTTLLSSTVDSSQAPTIGAFAPVQAAIGVDHASANAAPVPAEPARPAVDANTVVDQMLHGVFMNTAGDLSTVRMRLHPESLGDISVKLTIEGGNVSASVVAQTSAAHDALVAGQAQLTKTLADAGLKLSSFTVNLAGGFSSFQQHQQQTSQNGTPNGRPMLGGVDTPESDDALMAAPNFGPPVLPASQNWSALNYLA